MKLKNVLHFSLITLVTFFVQAAAHAQTFSVIHTFIDSVDGSVPEAGVTIRFGKLYGTTTGFLANVFGMQRMGSDWQLTSLLYNSEPNPKSRVLFGPEGRLLHSLTPEG